MTAKVRDLAASLTAKINLIVERQQLTEETLAQTRSERDVLAKRVAQLEAEVKALKNDLHFASMSSTLAQSPQHVADTRSLLAGLIRDIDRCIADIKAC